ncbi:TrkH family potassium uptake protein [Pseudogemmobacter blasticus]|uniref:Potassium transporter TrkH n=1 Tax=Fuscovulum blasticum DSM 2131 TaxID=1188250 RepID=A0A2T4JAU8_FUSBL|nr:potassium transporter TrkG [Fuscovulum blasticum]AWD20598.1 potassium transporter TrkH [Fuscovulum blasticum]PTE14958.1 potassium transporter TrkH [Fuscovulum blasticum DSM 2131]
MLARLTALPLLVVLLGGTALVALLPSGHALILGDMRTARAFFYAALMLAVLTVMLGLATAHWRPRNAARAQLAALVGAYVVLPVAMALPVVWAVRDTSLINAWFEMMTCFTTTGSSVYEPGRLPPSVHLWRALVSWLGGYFILLAAYAILAPLNLGGAEVISGRVPGRGAHGATQITRVADPALRLSRYAMAILPVYAGLTLALWVALLIAGEDGLLALTHAMGTLSTSGVSAGIGLSVTGSGLAGEVLILGFLVFALSRRLMPVPGVGLSDRKIWHDPELRLAAFLTAVVVLVLMTRHLMSEVEAPREMATATGIARALWGAMFTALSFLTTTGYESAYWSSARDWAGLGAPGLMLLGLAIVGGGVATTAGGVKLLRVYALLRQGERELERIIHPNSVGGQGAEGRRLRGEGAYMAWVFFMLFALSIGLVTAVLTLTGQAFQPALVLGISALTTTGPLIQVATAEPLSYAVLSNAEKIVLGVTMVVGRLETLALIALVAPGGWRGKAQFHM